MLMLFVILGLGLLIAGVYKALDDGDMRHAKLDRVQRKIAQLEAEQASRDTEMPETETSTIKPKDFS